MKVEFQQEIPQSQYQNNSIKLVLTNTSQQFANLIRRYLISKVQTVQILGIPNSDLNTFDSLEHNLDDSTDVIQAKIQNIPLNFSIDQIKSFQKDNYLFKLDTYNDTVDNLMTTTQDIQIFDADNQRYSNQFIRSIFPPNPDFSRLFILQPQQHLHFTAYAIKADSTTHSIFNHLTNLIVTPCVNNDLAESQLNHLLSNTSEADKQQVITDFNTTDRFRCFDKDQFGQPFNFDIYFEIISSLPPKFALHSACSQAVTDIQDLVNNLHILQSPDDYDLFSVYISHELSIGFLLQYTMALDLFKTLNKNDLITTPKPKKKLEPTKDINHFSLTHVAFSPTSSILDFRYSSNVSIDIIQALLRNYLGKNIVLLNSLLGHLPYF